jgi:hypothetical protein
VEDSRARLIAKELQFLRSSPTRPLYFHDSSMEPLLADGDEVAIEPVAWDEIGPGDIVTYRFEDKFPTRRVIAKRSDRLVLACDNWPLLRFEAYRDDVLGRAVGRCRAGSWLRATDSEWHRARRVALRQCRLVFLHRVLASLRRRLTGIGVRESTRSTPR